MVVNKVDRLSQLAARLRKADGPLQPRQRRLRQRDPECLGGPFHGPNNLKLHHEL